MKKLTLGLLLGLAPSLAFAAPAGQAPFVAGTGGTQPLTLGTTPTPNAIPPAIGLRRSLLVYNQSPTASVTLCMNSGATAGVVPQAGAAGCYTLNPNGGQLAYPANGYVPQDGFNAAASAANTPVTVESH